MNKLLDTAKKFEHKLGLSNSNMKVKNANSYSEKLPKNIRKIAEAEHILQKEISKRMNAISKVYGDVVVKTAENFTLPALFKVCTICAGRGKIAHNKSTETIKLASSGISVPIADVVKCSGCKGKRVVKTIDTTKCSQKELAIHIEFTKQASADKKMKKVEKANKKAAKAISKAEAKQLEAIDPEGASKMKQKNKAEKKAMKAAKKAEKKIKKAHKVAEKAGLIQE